MRAKGCLTPGALLLVVGGNLLAWGLGTESRKTIEAGTIFLILATAFVLGALYFRWQGWGE